MSIWAAVDHLLDEAEDLAALRAHGLHLLAARRWREAGRSVPPDLLADERSAAIAALAMPSLLARVRAALDGPILLLKGPEVAARYPDPALRPLGDVDLLVPDAAEAEGVLRAIGFEPAEGERTAARQPHQPPLRWPTSPLRVELHHALPVPQWSSPRRPTGCWARRCRRRSPSPASRPSRRPPTPSSWPPTPGSITAPTSASAT